MIDINIKKLIQIVSSVAKHELLPRFAKVHHQFKNDGSIVTEADVITQKRLSEQLLQHWPETVLLGEEMSIEEQATILSSDNPVWCLDPLDGTSNFAAGIPYFAVSLSLMSKGMVVLGLVYDPIRDECFFAQDNTGAEVLAYLNDKPLVRKNTSVSLSQSIAIVDFKRLSNALATRIVTERPFASQRNFGASALDWCWLAAGRGHVYLHGKQNLWDYAAGELIFRSSNGISSTLNGEAVFMKTLEKRSVVAAVNSDLFSEWSSWLGIQGEIKRT